MVTLMVAAVVSDVRPSGSESPIWQTVSQWVRDTERDHMTFTNRGVIWSRAMDAVQTSPVAGIGLGTFRAVLHTYGPLPVWIPDPSHIPHAHNTFLQVVLDVGLIGLTAYLALLIVAWSLCWHVGRAGPERIAPLLASGLAGNLLAVHVFGLADAIALGAKVGIFFWFNLGLIGVMFRLSHRQLFPFQSPSRSLSSHE